MLDKFIHTTTIHIYIIYIQAQANYDKQIINLFNYVRYAN